MSFFFRSRTRDTSWLASVVIRPLTKDDLPALEWEGEYQHFRRVFADAYEHYRKGLSVLWVADLPGRGIIGQVFVQLTCDRPELANGYSRAYLYSFRVRPAYRGFGLGTKLMQTVEDDLRQRHFSMITLNVARENSQAMRLYLRRGYRVVAPEKGAWSYLDDEGMVRHVEEPAWRMEKKL